MYTTNCALKLRYVLEASKIRLDVQIFFGAMELLKIIKSKVVRFPAAIESWKASFFVRNICTHAGWRKSVAIWICKLPAAIQAEAKGFELLLLLLTVQCGIG